MRVYRAVYQARSSIEGMWRGNPILTALLFGLPAGFLSLICYSICCQDIMDADDEEDEGQSPPAPPQGRSRGTLGSRV